MLEEKSQIKREKADRQTWKRDAINRHINRHTVDYQ